MLNQRLVQKLCDACRGSLAPTAEILGDWGFLKAACRPFTAPRSRVPMLPRSPCQKCGAIGYLGRTAIYELLVVGGTRSQGVVHEVQGSTFCAERHRKDGMQSLQEEGRLAGGQRNHVVAGVDSRLETIRKVVYGRRADSKRRVPDKHSIPPWNNDSQFLISGPLHPMSYLLTVLLLTILAACVGSLYTEGIWSNAMHFINVVTAGLLAMNFFEPVARGIEEAVPSGSLVADFAALGRVRRVCDRLG